MLRRAAAYLSQANLPGNDVPARPRVPADGIPVAVTCLDATYPARAHRARHGRVQGRRDRHRCHAGRPTGDLGPGRGPGRGRLRGRDVLPRLPDWTTQTRLTGVRLVISDQHAGLVAAIARTMQGSSHQRCRVHFIRNVLAHVGKVETEMQWDKVAAELAAPLPQERNPDGRRDSRGTGVRGLPPRTLAQDLVHQPVGYLEPRRGCR